MALSWPAHVAVTAVSTDLHSITAPAAGPSGSSADPAGCASSAGTSVDPQGPVLRSRVSSAQPSPSSLNIPYQFTQPVGLQHGSSAMHGNGIFISAGKAPPSPKSSALIDIEDSGDGSITFKYGALEDLWDLDRLLEFVCGGAFNIHTAETFVPVIIELFKVPISYTGQRRMVKLLSGCFRLDNDFSTAETEKRISQVLAEAASEFLPPSNVGSYSKGRSRPRNRFSSREDQWWNTMDDYFGVGVGSADFLPESSFAGLEGYHMQPSSIHRKHSTYKPFRSQFSGSSDTNVSQFIWKDAPKSGMANPPHRLSSYAPKTPTLEVCREDDSAPGLEEGHYIPDLGFVSRPSQADTPEDAVSKAEVTVNGAGSDHFASPFANLDTLPAASIQAMMEWEQEDVVAPVSLPSKDQIRVKVSVNKSTRRIKSKTTQRVRGSTVSRKSASKNKKPTERRNESKLVYDLFFVLPVSHKSSGVARFLQMRKTFSDAMLVVLNNAAVGLAAAGLASTLHVVARMLSVNATLDSIKVFGVVRGAALLCFSAAMQSLTKVMLRLPAGCSVSDLKDKTQVFCLQQQLRRLSFTALTVIVLSVFGPGF